MLYEERKTARSPLNVGPELLPKLCRVGLLVLPNVFQAMEEATGDALVATFGFNACQVPFDVQDKPRVIQKSLFRLYIAMSLLLLLLLLLSRSRKIWRHSAIEFCIHINRYMYVQNFVS